MYPILLNTVQFLNPETAKPVALGCVETYQSDGVTPKVVYSDNGLTPHANPIKLDEYGVATIFSDSDVFLIVKDQNGAMVTQGLASVIANEEQNSVVSNIGNPYNHIIGGGLELDQAPVVAFDNHSGSYSLFEDTGFSTTDRSLRIGDIQQGLSPNGGFTVEIPVCDLSYLKGKNGYVRGKISTDAPLSLLANLGTVSSFLSQVNTNAGVVTETTFELALQNIPSLSVSKLIIEFSIISPNNSFVKICDLTLTSVSGASFVSYGKEHEKLRFGLVGTEIQDAINLSQNADNILQANIDAESLARENADNALQANIDSEASARISAISQTAFIDGDANRQFNVGDGLNPTNAINKSQLDSAISSLPVDNFVNGFMGYDEATNTLTLSTNNGGSIDLDMVSIINDAVATVPLASTTAAGIQENANRSETSGLSAQDKTVTPDSLSDLVSSIYNSIDDKANKNGNELERFSVEDGVTPKNAANISQLQSSTDSFYAHLKSFQKGGYAEWPTKPGGGDFVTKIMVSEDLTHIHYKIIIRRGLNYLQPIQASDYTGLPIKLPFYYNSDEVVVFSLATVFDEADGSNNAMAQLLSPDAINDGVIEIDINSIGSNQSLNGIIAGVTLRKGINKFSDAMSSPRLPSNFADFLEFWNAGSQMGNPNSITVIV